MSIRTKEELNKLFTKIKAEEAKFKRSVDMSTDNTFLEESIANLAEAIFDNRSNPQIRDWAMELGIFDFLEISTATPNTFKEKARKVRETLKKNKDAQLDDLVEEMLTRANKAPIERLNEENMQDKFPMIYSQYSEAKRMLEILENRYKKLNSDNDEAVKKFMEQIKSGNIPKDTRFLPDGFPEEQINNAKTILKLRDPLNRNVYNIIEQALKNNETKNPALGWLRGDVANFFIKDALLFLDEPSKKLVKDEITSKVLAEPTLPNIIQAIKNMKIDSAQGLINDFFKTKEGEELKARMKILLGQKANQYIDVLFDNYQNLIRLAIRIENPDTLLAESTKLGGFLNILYNGPQKKQFNDIIEVIKTIKDSMDYFSNTNKKLGVLSGRYTKQKELSLEESWKKITIYMEPVDSGENSKLSPNKEVSITLEKDQVIFRLSTGSFENIKFTVEKAKEFSANQTNKMLKINIEDLDTISGVMKLANNDGLDPFLGDKTIESLDDTIKNGAEEDKIKAKDILQDYQDQLKTKLVELKKEIAQTDKFPKLVIEDDELDIFNQKIKTLQDTEDGDTEESIANIDKYETILKKVCDDQEKINKLKVNEANLLEKRTNILAKIQTLDENGTLNQEVVFLKTNLKTNEMLLNNVRHDLAASWKEAKSEMEHINFFIDRLKESKATPKASAPDNFKENGQKCSRKYKP